MRRAFLMSVLVILVAACATSPTGRRQLLLFPESQMTEMGATAFLQMQEQVPISKDPAVNRYVECVADAITEQLPEKRDWEVRVFSDQSANAFALPGGKIGVHSGLFKVAKNQDQLAAVIGHEVGHVIAEHSNERVSTAFATNAGLQVIQALAGSSGMQQQQLAMGLLGLGAQFGILLPFSRTQESEADIIGLQLMAKAGFDPRESIALWENMQRAADGEPPEFLSTHPSYGTRVSGLQGGMNQAMKLYQQARAAGRTPHCQ
jgi:predicted Zn-dependent protease